MAFFVKLRNKKAKSCGITCVIHCFIGDIYYRKFKSDL